MAVFPDRIILKNSTDDQAAIESAIGTGGTDEIQQGEIVIGRESGSAQLYTVDADGAIVTISGGGGATALGDLTDVDLTTTPPTDGQALVYDLANAEWVPGSVAAGSGGLAYWGGGDFDTGVSDGEPADGGSFD